MLKKLLIVFITFIFTLPMAAQAERLGFDIALAASHNHTDNCIHAMAMPDDDGGVAHVARTLSIGGGSSNIQVDRSMIGKATVEKVTVSVTSPLTFASDEVGWRNLS